MLGVVALGLAAPLGPAGAAAAAPPAAAGGGVSISPAKVVASVHAGTYTFDVHVADHQRVPLKVELSPASLGQQTSGTPTFGPARDTPLRIGTRSFVLGPGGQRTVPVRAVVTPRTAGVYGAVLATFAPTTPGRGNVAIRAGLASLVELTGPGRRRSSASITRIDALGSRKSRHVSFEALVRDTGNVLVQPVGTATVIDDRGRRLATVPLGRQRIVPGATVMFSGAWDAPRALSGPVTVRVTLVHPSAEATTTVVFRGGAAPLVGAALTDLHAVAHPGGVTLRVRVTDTGNTPLPATLTTAVFNGRTYRPLATTAGIELAPNQSRSVRQELRLGVGSHELSVRALADGQVLDQRQLSVRVPAASGGGTLWLVLGGALVLLGGGSGLARCARRRRHRALVVATPR